MVRKALKWAAIGVAVLFVIGVIDFLTWRSQRIKSLESNSQLIQTAHGVVEYAIDGSGAPVLVLHGSIGGYDQGQGMAKVLDGYPFQRISVSRPGYLRTPLESGAGFDEQADAYAALLDALGIDKVAVIATSGGGPSALEFALRYPDRCWAMVLIAANSDVNADGKKKEGKADDRRLPDWIGTILFSDGTSWAVSRISQVIPGKTIAALVGEDYVSAIQSNSEKYKMYTELLNSVSLLSRRRDGILNDGKQILTFTGHPFEKITCPTLILYGTKDTLMEAAQQEYLRKTLPGAKYVEVEGGTHFMVISHAEVLGPMIHDFLKPYAP